MVQLIDEVPRARMFHKEYPCLSFDSDVTCEHFASVARELLGAELLGPDPFAVEIGCDDGVMLQAISDAGVRHLKVDPSRRAADAAADKGIDVLVDFFEESSALAIREKHGPADVIFSANTTSHIAYIDSILSGVAVLLAPDGVFVIEDPYLADIIEHNYFDQVYDEHFYLFSAHSVANTAARFGLELIDARRLPVHGGSVRYTLARVGARPQSPALLEVLAGEREAKLDEQSTFHEFAADIGRIGADLVTLLEELRAAGQRVAGYGATSRSSTITNFLGIGPELISYISDSTPEKQGRLTPGSHIPIVPPEVFTDPYPDYAVLFAWNHAEEIMAKERAFTEQGGKWILYVPDVHIVGHGEYTAAA